MIAAEIHVGWILVWFGLYDTQLKTALCANLQQMFAGPSGGDVNFMFKVRGHLFKSTGVQNKREEEGGVRVRF